MKFDYGNLIQNIFDGLYLVDLNGPRHMAAWDGYQVFDPKGYVSDLHNHRGNPLAFFMIMTRNP